MPDGEFQRRKLIGTAAEEALSHLIALAGGIVTTNQINRDLVQDHPGAAIARYGAMRVHLPDIGVVWPLHPLRRFSIEAKAKRPLAGGGWGWDRAAYDRAARWCDLTGETVLYVIRDLSRGPLPTHGEIDEIDHWTFASVWKLGHSANRATDHRYHFWPASEFVPLSVLFECDSIAAQLVPYIPADGRPPIIL